MSREDCHWFAVHVRSNQESKTAEFLADREIPCFLPTYRVRSRRSDRRITLTRPLFSGYLFVHIDLRDDARVQVLKAPGTVKLVRFGDQTTPVPDETIQSLQILVRHGEDQVRPHPLAKAGSTVLVTNGPFSGARGILAQTDDRKPRLVVEIEFLGRAVSVPIEPEQVDPVFD
jgi:transcriptional antiterminator NusG